MKPSDAFEAIADILTGIVKKPFRDEPMSVAEWDALTEQVLLLAAREKAKNE